MVKRMTLDSSKWSALEWAFCAAVLAGIATAVPAMKWWAIVTGGVLSGATLASYWAGRLARQQEAFARAQEESKSTQHHVATQPFDERLIVEARAHREWLHSSLQTVAWACGIVLTAGLGVAIWVLGDSAEAAAGSAASRTLEEKGWPERIEKLVNAELDNAMKDISVRIRTALGDEVTSQVAAKIKDATKVTIGQMVGDVAKKEMQFYLPIGCVVAWPTNDTLPNGWEICDGREVTCDSLLWKRLRGHYGNSSGTKQDKVKLPDFRGYFLRGQGGQSLDIGAPQAPAIGEHAHTMSYEPAIGADGTPNPARFATITTDKTTNPEKRAGSTQSNIGHAPETRPSNYAVHWIIRVN